MKGVKKLISYNVTDPDVSPGAAADVLFSQGNYLTRLAKRRRYHAKRIKSEVEALLSEPDHDAEDR